MAILSCGTSANACTIFVVVSKGQVLFCNNEDFTKPGLLWFVPAQAGRLGRVNLGFEPDFAQGSMNEKGLAFDSNALSAVPWTSDPSRPTPHNLIEKIMDECGTVKEAIEYFHRFNCTHLDSGQFLFADATGDAAVIAWLPTRGLSISRIQNERFISTNTRLESSGYRCQRFVKTSQVLDTLKNKDAISVTTALDAVHQRGPGGFTSYSNVFDLKSRKIHLYNLSNFEEVCELDLNEELAKGRRDALPLASLFQRSPTLSEIQAGEQRVEFGTRCVLSKETLDRYAGVYRPVTATNMEFKIERVDGVLVVHHPGQPDASLYPEGEALFRIAPDRGQVSFVLDAQQQVTGLILHKGQDLKADKVR